jgi:hypothetical protein
VREAPYPQAARRLIAEWVELLGVIDRVRTNDVTTATPAAAWIETRAAARLGEPMPWGTFTRVLSTYLPATPEGQAWSSGGFATRAPSSCSGKACLARALSGFWAPASGPMRR